MSTEVITIDAWEAITAAAQRRKQRAWVAVAFFGKDGPDLLPLAPGSRLVVNASEDAVKLGLTRPASLKEMVANDVLVYSVANLHAKVFVFGRMVFIGSTNASGSSADTLIEAVIRTTDRNSVADAREFVQSQCLVELGPAELDRLQKLYRPPKRLVGRRMAGAQPPRRNQSQLPRLHLAHLELSDPPEDSEETAQEGREEAKSKMEHPRRHDLDEFFWHGRCAFRERDQVMQLTKGTGGAVLVHPVATVLNTREWSNGRASYTFVYLESPKLRRKGLDVVTTQLGRGSKKALRKNGLVRDRDFAVKLRQLWQG